MKTISFFALIALFTLTACAQYDGAKLFARAGCTTCHKYAGQGQGIDLSSVKDNRTHRWVCEQLTNPGSHRTDTGMPSFAHLKNSEIAALADYVMGR